MENQTKAFPELLNEMINDAFMIYIFLEDHSCKKPLTSTEYFKLFDKICQFMDQTKELGGLLFQSMHPEEEGSQT